MAKKRKKAKKPYIVGDGTVRVKTSRKFKDTLIRDVLHRKEYALEAYNAVSGENLPADTPIEYLNLDLAIFTDLRNDVAFMIDGRLVVFIEAQSTYPPNMPLRFLLYLVAVFTHLLSDRMEELYGTVLIELPTPQLIVLYDGKVSTEERFTLKLSDLFMKPFGLGKVELEAEVFNISYADNSVVLAKSEALKGYSYLIARIEHYLSEGYARDEAISKAVADCRSENILTDYLDKRGKGIFGMLNLEFN